jgi:hypothetical protein
MGHSLASGHGGKQRLFGEPPQQAASRMHTSSPGQSLFLSHSSVSGQNASLKSTHLLRPLTVLAQKQPGQSPHGDSGHLLLLTAGLSSHGPPSAPATPGNNESSPILPSRAPPLSLMAVPREMVPSASPLATSSKLSASWLCGKLSSLLVPSLGIVGPPSRLVQTLPGVFPL